MRLAALIVAVGALVAPAAAGKATYSCSTVPATLAYPQLTIWQMQATVPAKANTTVIVTGAGAPPNEWTGVSGTKRGNVQETGPAFIATGFNSTGTATVTVGDLDLRDGTFYPITTCTLDVLAGSTEGKESPWR